MGSRIRAAGAAAGWLLLATMAAAGEGKSEPAPAPLLPAAKRLAAADRAIRFLDEQLPRLPDSGGSPRKPFTYATAGLVYLMREGATATRSRGPDRLRRIVTYLTGWIDGVAARVRDPAQLPARHGVADSRLLVQYTWPLAQAGLLFAECRLRKRCPAEAMRGIRAIVALLEDAQQSNGGWGHGKIRPAGSRSQGRGPGDPFGDLGLKGGYPNTLVASSNCAAAALGLLSTLLEPGSVHCLPAARAYYSAARLPNGSFPYDPSQRSAGFAKTNAGRTAGALLAEHWLGVPHAAPGFRRSLDYVRGHIDYIVEAHGSPCLSLMHGALALRLVDAPAYERFRRCYERRIVAAQDADGAFRCICRNQAFGVTCDSRGFAEGGLFGRGEGAYITALHTFVLLLPRGGLRLLAQPPPAVPATRGG